MDFFVNGEVDLLRINFLYIAGAHFTKVVLVR